MLPPSRATKFFQPLADSFDTRFEPKRVELRTQIVSEKILAHHTVAFGKPHQASFVPHKPLIDVVKLLDQRVDARSVQPKRLHLANDLVLQLFILALAEPETAIAF